MHNINMDKFSGLTAKYLTHYAIHKLKMCLYYVNISPLSCNNYQSAPIIVIQSYTVFTGTLHDIILTSTLPTYWETRQKQYIEPVDHISMATVAMVTTVMTTAVMTTIVLSYSSSLSPPSAQICVH